MIDANSVLAGLPTALRSELLQAFESIAKNYVEHRWEPSELNGGKFCEIVFSIIDGVIVGAMPAQASKPPNFVTACRALESKQANIARSNDHSLRILIPRILLAMYDVRNNRNVGHIGGDVDPSFMDATVVYGMAGWVLAELVRIFHGVSTIEAQDTVDALVQRKHPIIWEMGDIRRVLDISLNIPDQTLALLYGMPGWVEVRDLIAWVEYGNASRFRSEILGKLHKSRLVEFDRKNDLACLTPVGVSEVEVRILESAV